MFTPTPVDRTPERHRLGPVIGHDLVKPHGEHLRSTSPLETLGGEVRKVLTLGQRKRIAETEGHAHRRHGVVVPGRITNKHSTCVPVRDARPQIIGRDAELPRLQRFDKRRPQGFRQEPGIRVRQKTNPVPMVQAVQWDIKNDPDAVLCQMVHENWTRSATQHMPITFQRQLHPFDDDPYHPRAGHRACR